MCNCKKIITTCNRREESSLLHMATTVEMAPRWTVRLCIAAGLTPVEVPHGGSGLVSV